MLTRAQLPGRSRHEHQRQRRVRADRVLPRPLSIVRLAPLPPLGVIPPYSHSLPLVLVLVLDVDYDYQHDYDEERRRPLNPIESDLHL